MKDYTVLDGQITCLRNMLYDEAYQRGYEDGQEYEQLLRTPKHDADRLEQIKDLIRECEKINAYTFSYPAWRLINKLKKIVGWQLEDYEERQTGEWVRTDTEHKCYHNNGTYITTEYNCSVCGAEPLAEYASDESDYAFSNFCPNCGAKMRKESE